MLSLSEAKLSRSDNGENRSGFLAEAALEHLARQRERQLDRADR
jgi:hypothetical protein